MKRKSHQRITKIKLDQILELLKKAENTATEDACTIEPATDQLTPYPDMDNLRIWTRDYLTKGLNKILINKLANDSQTYMTTLIDGLPLFTKMSKTVQGSTPTQVISGFANNITSSNVSLSDKGIATFGSSSGTVTIPLTTVMKTNSTYEIVFKATSLPAAGNRYLLNFASNKAFSVHLEASNNKLHLYYQTGAGITTGSETYLELNVQYKLTLTLNTKSVFTATIIKVEDGSTVLTTSNPSSHASYLGQLNFGLDLTNTEIDFTKSSITTTAGKIDLLSTSDIYPTTETSKPGLWLSNLIQPVSGSQAGSWLRSNLIHSNEDRYSLINSYVVGNYSNTFTQPALIMHPLNADKQNDLCPVNKYATGGDDMMYYNQHYSPALSSCINYVNQPDNNSYFSFPPYKFEYKYGSYQTVAFPSDPDMQTYTELNSSCLNYSFTNPNDNETTYNSTLYNLQAANSSQRPEAINNVTLKPNDTTGGSISGDLISYDDEGNKCVTPINYIFRSVQAMFAADYEYIPSDNSLNNTSYKPIKAYSQLNTCCFYHYYWSDSMNKFILASGYYRFKYSASMLSGYSCEGVYYTPEGATAAQPGFNSGNSGVFYDWDNGATCGSNSRSPSVAYSSSGYCGSARGRLDGILLPANTTTSDQSGINIYLHVKDLAAESRSKGIPFINPDCTQPAFQLNVDINASPKDFEKVYLIAENVSIDSLGNISTINEKIINLD